jgi:hypothetical protein
MPLVLNCSSTQAGILSEDSVGRKRALYLLKQTIAQTRRYAMPATQSPFLPPWALHVLVYAAACCGVFTRAFPHGHCMWYCMRRRVVLCSRVPSRSYVEAGAAQPVWTRRFQWSADRDAALQQTWEALFVLLDTLLFEKQVRMDGATMAMRGLSVVVPTSHGQSCQYPYAGAHYHAGAGPPGYSARRRGCRRYARLSSLRLYIARRTTDSHALGCAPFPLPFPRPGLLVVQLHIPRMSLGAPWCRRLAIPSTLIALYACAGSHCIECNSENHP